MGSWGGGLGTIAWGGQGVGAWVHGLGGRGGSFRLSHITCVMYVQSDG